MKAMDCRFIILVDSVVEFLSFDLIVEIRRKVCSNLHFFRKKKKIKLKLDAENKKFFS